MNRFLAIAPEVSAALVAGHPVVALESTIISHGMPYPQNLEMARRVEAIIREEGAVPATIAVADGRIHVGLDDALLQRLATAKDVAKLSRRDMGAILAAGGLGATTVAATMIGAHLAGIRVFATGGIGGVHRGAETSFDISADLEELARTPVAVVCAGAKSILDLPKTLEYLETRGVPVIGYGTDTLPAFFCRSSGLPLALRRDTPEELAALLAAQAALGLPAGAVIANPIPEAHALPEAEIDAAIASALADAGREGIAGKAVTPYLLARIVALTEGRSLAANIALVEHNARIAARIAKAWAAIG
ncbi:pseudouridine-5'-phosphate glycosidase [Inquilinus limosus]|uniref:pseudouridine-5'-phosphate glycosidase n=1 Tax=Inquilinus limosus TaxID=171674 RepID=UPI003F14AEA2